MLIRNQRKGAIINLQNTSMIFIKEKGYMSYENKGELTHIFHICTHVNNHDELVFLGDYSTVEKAMKVLDMIQSNYERRWEVFQMPQDNEVEI